MTVTTLRGRADVRSRIAAPADLSTLLGIPFSDQQLDAITAPLEPGLVVAGAGTGKTTVMAARVAWLVGTGRVRADEVLGLTFTTKAAAELSRRVREFLVRAGLASARGADHPDGVDAEEVAEPTVLTYHAYAARLLSEHGLRIGFEPDTRVVDDATRFQLAASAVRRHEGPVDRLTTWLPTAVTGLLALDAELSEHLVDPDEVRAFQRREAAAWQSAQQTKAVRDLLVTMDERAELLDLVEGYRRVKAERGVMDFSDQMALAARVAETRSEVGTVERERFRLVLLDEYQDTSVAQARLLRALFSDGIDAAGGGHPVTAVGDPCQAIYGWRGASVGNIESFATRFQGVGPQGERRPARRFPLSVNRRSERRILETANAVAQPLRAAFPSAEPLRAPPSTGLGDVRLSVVDTYADELALVAEGVVRAHAEDAVPWSQIAVLARDNTMIADLHDSLAAADVPVEVVGLSGLLRLPEVVEVVCTLEVLSDVTANPALLALLSGPRWAIGARDLALLGRRARTLARAGLAGAAPGATAGVDVSDGSTQVSVGLADAVSGVDSADLVALAEALVDPGPLPYDPEARRRFRRLADELRLLRRHVGEPLLDLVRRVVDVSGLEVELASSTSPVSVARRHNLATFLDAVTAFAGVDTQASLGGLLAYLHAEDEYGHGLSLALPSQADSVKLLTSHRAKGLEWDVVFVPGMARGVFPASRGASQWTRSASVLPAPLRGDADDRPSVRERSAAGLAAYAEACRDESVSEERRLAYVAATRPRRRLAVSCHWWGPRQLKPRGPSLFADDVRSAMAGFGSAVSPDAMAPDAEATNPIDRRSTPVPWPVEPGVDELDRRRAAGHLVALAREQTWPVAARAADAGLVLDELAVVQQWDLEIEALLEEATTAAVDEVDVALPRAISASTLVRAGSDPGGLARDLARRMPRRPSAAARFGTRFHAWVETYAATPPLLDPDDLPGRADLAIAGDAELGELIEAFRQGPYAERTPVAVEAAFSLALAGHVVRGRIDAVYATADGFEVVDWKTNREQTADPLQLATYRLAWSELTGVPIERVSACFCYVRTGEVVRFDDLPGRAELEALAGG